jgi:hypothetical protein
MFQIRFSFLFFFFFFFFLGGTIVLFISVLSGRTREDLESV